MKPLSIGGFGTVRLAILKAPEKESGNISEELDDIIPERSRLKNTKGKKISQSFENLLSNGQRIIDNDSPNSGVVMKSEQEESKFSKKRDSSPEEAEIVRSLTFTAKKDQEMYALKIISKAKVLESA